MYLPLITQIFNWINSFFFKCKVLQFYLHCCSTKEQIFFYFTKIETTQKKHKDHDVGSFTASHWAPKMLSYYISGDTLLVLLLLQETRPTGKYYPGMGESLGNRNRSNWAILIVCSAVFCDSQLLFLGEKVISVLYTAHLTNSRLNYFFENQIHKQIAM